MSSAALRLPDDPAQFWAGQLLRDGYCIIPDALPAEKIGALYGDLKPRFDKTPYCNGNFFGSGTKRFGGLLKRSPYAAALIQHKLILDIAQVVLGPNCDRFQLNLTQAIEIGPGEVAQIPHRDHDMWRGPKGEMEYLINVMWPLTPFRTENGATVVWPHSHGRNCNTKPLRAAAAISAEMDPGAALIFLGSTLHGGGANRTTTPRAGLVISYGLGWLKPYENQWLAYPPAVARHFPPALQELVGYATHRPNLGNYEGQSPAVLLRGDTPEYMQFTDELREEQLEPLADYVSRQRTMMQKPT
jgi:ectoine hydroxylase-related dioxygenase (phytanoyl-CoA dioxygenase family)